MSAEVIWGIDFAKAKEITNRDDAAEYLAKALSALIGEEVRVQPLNADSGYIAPPCDCA